MCLIGLAAALNLLSVIDDELRITEVQWYKVDSVNMQSDGEGKKYPFCAIIAIDNHRICYTPKLGCESEWALLTPGKQRAFTVDRTILFRRIIVTKVHSSL